MNALLRRMACVSVILATAAAVAAVTGALAGTVPLNGNEDLRVVASTPYTGFVALGGGQIGFNWRLDSTSNLLHCAVRGRTPGFVSVSFASTAGSMVPADAVLGWYSSGAGSVKAISVTSKDGKSLAQSSLPAGYLSGNAEVACVCRQCLALQPASL